MKHTSKTATKVTIEITTDELYNNIVAFFKDVIWDCKPSEVSGISDSLVDAKQQTICLLDIIPHLVSPTTESIRNIFKDGATMFILNRELMDVIEEADVVEVIVTDHLGVVHTVSNEYINY